MKIRFGADPHRRRGAVWFFLAILLILGASSSLQAQWTAADAQTAFSSYNNAFYFSPGGNNYDYRTQQGSTNTSGFWVGAEEIELAIDAYVQNPTTANVTIVNQLCSGFVAQFSSDWSGDTYDDDLMWATIAFIRAYNATGNKAWLIDAENNFATVWSRGYDTTFGGGIWWNVSSAHTSSGYKASASNWTFVIAGNLLYQTTGNPTYLDEANTIYNWASTTLYDASTGRVHDGINSSGIQDGQYSYNYGVAVGASYFENKWSDTTNIATYLISNLSGGAIGGYNIMPNYGQGGTDGGGFNSITLRWIGYAYARGAISNSNVLSWAQANVGLAWAQRNSSGLSWNNWSAPTPDGTALYSWDCSNTVAGMLDIPRVSNAADFSLTSSSDVLNVTAGDNGTATISIAPLNSFNGTVSLSATVVGAPAGVSATLSQNSVTESGTATLTVSTTVATPGANYLIAVTGVSGGVAHTAFVKLALPFFTLSIDTTNLYLDQGAKATSTITVLPQNGFNGIVHFSLPAGLPAGVIAWFRPEFARTETTFILAAQGNAVVGTAIPLSVTATSGALTQTVSTALTVSAGTGDRGTGAPVNLSAAFNGVGIYPKGATYATTAGIDGDGYSYSSDLLTSARVLSDVLFKIGPPDAPDVVYGTGQKIPLPVGRFTTLQLLATAIGGEQTAQPVIVTYTDGTTSQFTQSFSDWFSPSNNANETNAVVMQYRNDANGTQDNRPFTLYGYTFVLRSDKIVKSLTLPDNHNVVLLAATLTRQYLGDQVNLASAFNIAGVYSDGTVFPTNGGLDGGGTAYSANLLGTRAGASNIVVNGLNFNLGAPNVNNVAYGAGQVIPLPPGRFNTLRILGSGIGGNQTAQAITVTYTDGTTKTFTQSFSDWFNPQGYPDESIAEKMPYRLKADGTHDSRTFNLYQYSLLLDQRKIVKSLTLPVNRNVIVLGITLTSDLFDGRNDRESWWPESHVER
jgi:predicted alpha-1,6-mannanase (GH76 family)